MSHCPKKETRWVRIHTTALVSSSDCRPHARFTNTVEALRCEPEHQPITLNKDGPGMGHISLPLASPRCHSGVTSNPRRPPTQPSVTNYHTKLKALGELRQGILARCDLTNILYSAACVRYGKYLRSDTAAPKPFGTYTGNDFMQVVTQCHNPPATMRLFPSVVSPLYKSIRPPVTRDLAS